MMPDLYVTPNDHFTATQAEAAKATRREGSKPGSWKKVEVPTKKAALSPARLKALLALVTVFPPAS